MYAETSTTGINLIDMSTQHAHLIRDSLLMAAQNRELNRDERVAITLLIKELDAVIKKQVTLQSFRNRKVNKI